MNYTRSNTSYLVGKISRFTNNPTIYHWKTVKGALEYLRYFLEYKLH